MAQLAAWIMSPHLKKPIDPRKLITPDKPKEKTNPEKSQAVIDSLINQLGVS